MWFAVSSTDPGGKQSCTVVFLAKKKQSKTYSTPIIIKEYYDWHTYIDSINTAVNPRT